MRKRLVGTLITACFLLGFATLAYAGSSTISFSGGGGSILIITTAPGVTVDNFEVTSGGDFSAAQQLSTGSPTIILREGEFSEGGLITVITDTTDPGVDFGVHLSSDDSGYLGQSVITGYSLEVQLSAQGSGSGNLELVTNTEEQLDFQFNLMYDASTVDVIASADPFNLSWITQFDSSVQIGGIAWSD